MTVESGIRIRTTALSDVGKVRKANEDSYFISNDETLLVVCDGMGGQVAGGLASKIAVETVKDVYQNLKDEEIGFFLPDDHLSDSAKRLVIAVRIANRRLYKMTTRYHRLRGMGTTVVALCLDQSFATMVHVGDSRIFRMSGKNILQLTEDHSWLNELIEDEEINQEQIETFQEKNVITRALGISPRVKIDIHCEKYKSNDIYVLCTDGLHNSVNAPEIKRMIERSNGSLDATARKLVEKAKKRDGSDNITVAVARIEQDSQPTRQLGVSKTIVQEDEKTRAREDKYVVDNYQDHQGNFTDSHTVTGMSQKTLIISAVVLITGLICFIVGMYLKSSSPNNSYKRPVAQDIQRNTAIQTSDVLPANINQSQLSENAVMAVVFFNSQEDFDNALLHERAMVLDRIAPYKQNNNQDFNGSFSIFFIDANNNVFYKSSGMQLPQLEQKQRANK